MQLAEARVPLAVTLFVVFIVNEEAGSTGADVGIDRMMHEVGMCRLRWAVVAAHSVSPAAGGAGWAEGRPCVLGGQCRQAAQRGQRCVWPPRNMLRALRPAPCALTLAAGWAGGLAQWRITAQGKLFHSGFPHKVRPRIAANVRYGSRGGCGMRVCAHAGRECLRAGQ